MKISARNQLQGTVTEVNKGAVNSEVVIALAGGATVVAILRTRARRNSACKRMRAQLQ